jgi:hypothetical protein
MLRVQAPLYRQGPGYRFLVAIRPAAGSSAAAPLASSSGPALAKTLYKVSFPWTGIGRAYPLSSASDPIVGKGLRSLIGWAWSWRSSLLFCAPDNLVGAVPLLARQPLGEFCLHRPAPALPGGVASRLLAQPVLRTELVFSCGNRVDSWDASRHTAWPVVRPLSHPHDNAPCLFLHHLLSVSLHFVIFLCIFQN